MSARKNANMLDADTFDCDLYRLIVRAGRFAEADTGYAKGQWGTVWAQLRSARRTVRSMMHPDDLAKTEGDQ